MVNLTDFTKANLSYITPKDVIDNPTAIFVITSEPTLVEKEFEGQKSIRVHCEGEFAGQRKSLDLSKTNARIVSKALGDESRAWIGHQLILETYKMKNKKGTLQDAINVKEAK